MLTKLKNATSLALAAMASGGIGTFSAGMAFGQVEWQPSLQQLELRSYLQQHAMRQAEIALLEKWLGQPTLADHRAIIAADLVDLLNAELQSTIASRQPTAERIRQISTLVAEFPQLDSDQLQISIAYARFQSAKMEFENWIWNRTDSTILQSVNEQFQTLLEHAAETDRSITETLLEESLSDNTSLRDDLENRQAQIRYVIAWGKYYLAMLSSDAAQRSKWVTESRLEFRRLLEIPDGDTVADLKPGWLELQSEWVCRLLVGLSLCEFAAGDAAKANHGFEMLTDPQVPAGIYEHLSVWQFHARFFPGQLDAARALAEFWLKHPDSMSDRPAMVWSTVYMAGATWHDQQEPAASALALAGLSGLAAANQFDVVASLTSTYPTEIAGGGFFAEWIRGYLAVTQRESPETLRQGIARLEQALQVTEDVDPVLQARCRFHLAFAQYQNQSFEACAENIRRIAAVLRYADPAAAAQAMWLRCQALDKLAAASPAWRQPLRNALAELQSNFPDSDYARQAEFMAMMDRLHHESPDRAMQTLLAVAPTSQNYDHARYEVCRLWHRQWSVAQAEGSSADSEVADQALEAIERFYQERAEDQRPTIVSHLIHVCLLAADISLHRTEPELTAARIWLDRCVVWTDVIETNHIQNAELHFMRLALAIQQGDREGVFENATWLARNSNSLEHQRAALIQLCVQLDDQLSAGERDKELLLQAVETYERLVSVLEREDPDVKQNVNLQVALARLAEYLGNSDQGEAALKHYQRLLDAFPREIRYIEAAARLMMQTKQFDGAADLWRTIVSGSRQGTDQWLAAKLQLVRCLAHSDAESAADVLRQTRVLAPDLNERWSQAFDQLEQELGAQDDGQ